MPVTLYRWYYEDGTPVDTTVGFVKMQENKLAVGDNSLDGAAGDALGYKPNYKYSADEADVALALKVKKESGPR